MNSFLSCSASASRSHVGRIIPVRGPSAWRLSAPPTSLNSRSFLRYQSMVCCWNLVVLDRFLFSFFFPWLSFPRLMRSFGKQASTTTRTENDAFGDIQVPSDRYWGAQTERSLENFKINQPQDRMPPPIVRAFGILKGAAAKVNTTFGLGNAINSRDWPRLRDYKIQKLAKRYNRRQRRSLH